MTKENKNYLGVDWGASDMGIALANNETKIAFEYTTLRLWVRVNSDSEKPL